MKVLRPRRWLAVGTLVLLCGAVATRGDGGGALPGDDAHITVLYACPNCPAAEREQSRSLEGQFRSGGALGDLPKLAAFHEHTFNDPNGMRYYNAGYRGPWPRVVVQQGSDVVYTENGKNLCDTGIVHDKILRGLLRGRREPEPRATPPPPLPPPPPPPAPAQEARPPTAVNEQSWALPILASIAGAVAGFATRFGKSQN